jgi:hypothetical protein
MSRITIDGNQKYPRPYWPKELKDDGFIGDLEIISSAFTAVIIHPMATLEQASQSLEVALRDIKLRIDRKESFNGKLRSNKS